MWFFRNYSTFEASWILQKEQLFACIKGNRFSIDDKRLKNWRFALWLESSLCCNISFHKMINKSAFSWVLCSIDTTKNELKLGIFWNNLECLCVDFKFILLIDECQGANLACGCLGSYAAMTCNLILRQLVYFWRFGLCSDGRWLFNLHLFEKRFFGAGHEVIEH